MRAFVKPWLGTVAVMLVLCPSMVLAVAVVDVVAVRVRREVRGAEGDVRDLKQAALIVVGVVAVWPFGKVMVWYWPLEVVGVLEVARSRAPGDRVEGAVGVVGVRGCRAGRDAVVGDAVVRRVV